MIWTEKRNFICHCPFDDLGYCNGETSMDRVLTMNDSVTIRELREDYLQQKLLRQVTAKSKVPSYVVFVLAVLASLLAYQML